MAFQKLSSTDAFIVVDFPDAAASGIVRRARKILTSSATDLARSATYTFGVFGIARSGASAGINAEDDGADAAIEAFVAELAPRAGAGELQLVAGKGVEPSQVVSLAPGLAPDASEVALVAGIVATAIWAVDGSLDGRTVAIEGAEQAPSSLVAALTGAGATVVDVWGVAEKPWLVWGAEVDVLLAGSRPGVLTHQGAGMISARALVPWGPIPVTTKAFAQLHRAGAVQVVPDFLSTAGPLLAAAGTPVDEVGDRIVEQLDRNAAHADGLFLGACHQAEEFLLSWQGSKPFGRPLAA